MIDKNLNITFIDIIYHYYYIFHKYPKDCDLSYTILNNITHIIRRFYYTVFF